MACADLRKELECSVCLSIYTDPVTLTCGHSFCQACISRVLDTQETHVCPDCRQEFPERPAQHKNISLRNIAEKFRATQPSEEEVKIFCTYCVYSSVPALKSCLHCEASLCEDHLRVHSKSTEHVLLNPTTSLGNRKCSVHKKILEYYCTEDAVCICVSCRLDGEHQGHQVEMLDEAFQKKSNELRSHLQSLTARRQKIEDQVQSVQERWRQVQDTITKESDRFAGIFRDLEGLGKRISNEISVQRDHLSLSVSDLILRLETSKDELAMKMQSAEELCNMADPLTILHYPVDCEGKNTSDGFYDGKGLDIFVISGMLHTGLSNIMPKVTNRLYMPKHADITLDKKTIGRRLLLLDDMKTAEKSENFLDHPETVESFYYDPQVISMQTFSSGQHYWEVDVSKSWNWRVGMCYPSIGRKRGESFLIGCNEKSWSLCRVFQGYSVEHDSNQTHLPSRICSDQVRIYLDYEVGRISFYDLCVPIRHIYTFTATFTEPLHAALYVWKGSITIRGENQKV